MHITQSVSSEEIARTGKIEITEIISPDMKKALPLIEGSPMAVDPNFQKLSAAIKMEVKDHRLYKKITFDLNDDPRLDKLVEAVKAEIKKHGWDPARNEKEISEKTVQLLHSDKFFGGYNEKSGALQGDIYKKKPEALADAATSTLENDRKTRLKDFGKNELVCKQEAAITSYTLHKVGIPNDYCAGIGIDAMSRGHAFVQTKSGNIIETTDPDSPFNKTVTGQKVSKGQVAIVIDQHKHYHGYGGGNIPAMEAIAYTFSSKKDDILKKDIPQNSLHDLLEAGKHDKKLHEKLEKMAHSLKAHGIDIDNPATVYTPQPPHAFSSQAKPVQHLPSH